MEICVPWCALFIASGCRTGDLESDYSSKDRPSTGQKAHRLAPPIEPQAANFDFLACYPTANRCGYVSSWASPVKDIRLGPPATKSCGTGQCPKNTVPAFIPVKSLPQQDCCGGDYVEGD
jgi:hypothetical protein